jgi:23S rRNA (adenine2503-C2)-methyltransferase
MGEPLANYDSTWAAIRRIHRDMEIGARHLTVSTVGLVPGILRMAAEELPVGLAVSLHAADDELRDELVPINRKHPIAELLAACWHYVEKQNARGVTFEYVMLDGVNDRPEHARQLAALLRGHPAKVNLIPFNPFPNTRFRRSSDAAIERFRDLVLQGGVIATIRRTRGDDIDAACGQLVGRVNDRVTNRLGQKAFPIAVVQA